MEIFLVTGGAGFIGSHLVEDLVQKGYYVRIIDNLSTGKKENIASVLNNRRLKPAATPFQQNVEFILADICELQQIQPFFKNVDGIFHLAAIPSVELSLKEPQKTHQVNVDGTFNVLLAALKNGVKKIVYASSCSVYGTSPLYLSPHGGRRGSGGFKESQSPNPLSPYALQKYIGEEYCRLFSKCYQLKTVSLRYFNVYGPRMSDTGAYRSVIKIFYDQKKNNQPLTITGDGTQTRDFVYVSDVVKATIRAMESDRLGKGPVRPAGGPARRLAGGEVLNIGSGKNYSVNEVAAIFDGPTMFIPPRLEPHDALADISLAKELLEWESEMGLEEGIKNLIYS